MIKYIKWFLIIPVFILALGTFILLSNEITIQRQIILNHKTTSSVQVSSSNKVRDFPKRASSYGEDLKNNRESAYPYFLLGAGLLLFLLILPKLIELSFSPSNGFTLKILQDVQDSLINTNTAALNLESKAKQSSRASIAAEPSLFPGNFDLNEEIKVLEANRIKLETYIQLLSQERKMGK